MCVCVCVCDHRLAAVILSRFCPEYALAGCGNSTEPIHVQVQGVMQLLFNHICVFARARA